MLVPSKQYQKLRLMMDEREMLGRGGAHARKARGALAYMAAFATKVMHLPAAHKVWEDLVLWRGVKGHVKMT